MIDKPEAIGGTGDMVTGMVAGLVNHGCHVKRPEVLQLRLIEKQEKQLTQLPLQ